MREITQMEWEGFKSAMDEKQARIEALEKALREIADFDDCDCESCQSCIAKKSLRGGE